MWILWNTEYIITLAACFYFVGFRLPRVHKHRWARLLIGLAVVAGVWMLRLIPGYSESWDILFYFAIYLLAVGTAIFAHGLGWVRAIFYVAVAGTLQHAAYKMSLTTLSLIDPELRHQYVFLAVEYAFVALGCFAATFTIGKRLQSQDFPINHVLTFVIAGALALATIVISFYTQEILFPALNENKIALSLINFLSVLLCIAGIGLLYESTVARSLREENYILHMLSRKDKERYELAKMTAEAISIKYHDLKHAMAERTLEEEEKLELQKTETDYMSLMFSGNKALDLVLIEKRRIGEERGVHLQAVVDGSLMNFMKEYQIYSMFGNILDNAIEACEKLANPEDKVIHLKIFKSRGNVVVEEINKLPAPLNYSEGLPKTTKENARNHGFGIKSIRSVCMRYNGMLQIREEGGNFVLKLVFPYVEQEQAN